MNETCKCSKTKTLIVLVYLRVIRNLESWQLGIITSQTDGYPLFKIRSKLEIHFKFSFRFFFDRLITSSWIVKPLITEPHASQPARCWATVLFVNLDIDNYFLKEKVNQKQDHLFDRTDIDIFDIIK